MATPFWSTRGRPRLAAGNDGQSSPFERFLPPFLFAGSAAEALFFVGIGAFIDVRHATRRACSARAFSGSSWARLRLSPISSRRLYSSSRPSSRNSISFQSPAWMRLTGVVRHWPGPAPR